MAIYALGEFEPTISPSAYVHPDAVVIGRVFIGDQASIWPSAVLRGDSNEIHIGARTSIQDGTIVHTTHHVPTIIGAECAVGHNAYLEGCTVEDRCLIGSTSLVLHDVLVEHDAVVAAGAVVRERTVVKSETIVAGVPATERGPRSAGFDERMRHTVTNYIEFGERYAKELRRLD